MTVVIQEQEKECKDSLRIIENLKKINYEKKAYENTALDEIIDRLNFGDIDEMTDEQKYLIRQKGYSNVEKNLSNLAQNLDVAGRLYLPKSSQDMFKDEGIFVGDEDESKSLIGKANKKLNEQEITLERPAQHTLLKKVKRYINSLKPKLVDIESQTLHTGVIPPDPVKKKRVVVKKSRQHT